MAFSLTEVTPVAEQDVIKYGNFRKILYISKRKSTAYF